MYLDGEVPGLYLRVIERGSKSWILRTVVTGKPRDISLGGYPTVSLADARKTARKYRAIAPSGGNPIAFRTQAPAPTFKVTAEQVHQQQIIPASKNAIHQNQWINTLRDYIFPEIGELSVGEAIGAMWDEIDFENTNWTVPGNRMKGDVELSSPTIANYH